MWWRKRSLTEGNGRTREWGLCEEWVLSCPLRNFVLLLCWRKWLSSISWAVPGRHFLGSVLVPAWVAYPKWRGFTRGDRLRAPLSSCSHSFCSLRAGALPGDLDTAPQWSTKKEAEQWFGLLCMKGAIPQCTWAQVLIGVSAYQAAPGAEGKASVPALLTVPHGLTRAGPGAGRRLPTSDLAPLFPFMPTGGLGSDLAFASSPRMAATCASSWGPSSCDSSEAWFSVWVFVLVRHCTKRKLELPFVFAST